MYQQGAGRQGGSFCQPMESESVDKIIAEQEYGNHFAVACTLNFIFHSLTVLELKYLIIDFRLQDTCSLLENGTFSQFIYKTAALFCILSQ